MTGMDSTALADQMCATMFDTITAMAAEVRNGLDSGIARDQMAITGARVIRERYATPEQIAVIASFALVRLAEQSPGGERR